MYFLFLINLTSVYFNHLGKRHLLPTVGGLLKFENYVEKTFVPPKLLKTFSVFILEEN